MSFIVRALASAALSFAFLSNIAQSQSLAVTDESFATTYADRRFDQITWLVAHNAHVNNKDAAWSFPNQDRSIADQLKDGVRGLMIDTYSYQNDVYLCHGDCNGIIGIGYALPRQTLSSVMNTVLNFLDANHDAIITVFLEDYANANDLAKVLAADPRIADYLFNPYSEKVSDQGWPTIGNMIARNKRLLMISDHSDKKSLGVAFGKDFTVENYWSLGLFGTDTVCRSRWDEIPLNRTYSRSEPLFVMNHFRDIPSSSSGLTDNKPSKLGTRLTDICMPAAQRRPTFLAVDYYEVGANGEKAQDTVNRLNQSPVEIWSDQNFAGRVQLLAPGSYAKASLTLGANTLSSLRLMPGTRVTLFGNDDYTAALGDIESSLSFVGSAWNDRTASITVLAP